MRRTNRVCVTVGRIEGGCSMGKAIGAGRACASAGQPLGQEITWCAGRIRTTQGLQVGRGRGPRHEKNKLGVCNGRQA